MEKTMQQGIMRLHDEAKTVSMGSNTVTFHLLLLSSLWQRAAGTRPPMHIHESESEATYMFKSELLLMLGERSMRASIGAVLFVSKGTKHTLSNLGSGTDRTLVILTRAGFEKFWEEMANLLKVSGGKPDPAHVLSLQQKYHMDTGGKPRQV